MYFEREDDVALGGFCSGGVWCRAWTAAAAAFEAAAANATQAECGKGAGAAGVDGTEDSGG